MMVDIQRLMADAAAKKHKEEQQARGDAILKYQSQLYDKASGYTKLIIGLGYAGFFTAWSANRQYLSRTEALVSALALVVSITFFVGFEVFQMVVTTANLSGLRRLANAAPEQIESTIEQEKLKEAKRTNWLMRIWFAALVLTIAPGLTAAAIMVRAFVRQLLRP